MTTTTTLTYELRVEGHLDDHWSSWLADLDLARHEDGTSTLVGPMADQAQLHGVLARLRDIGATLLSLRTVDAHPGRDTPTADPGRRPALQQPVRTERLTLRAATAADADASFAYRRLEPVGRWITSLPTDLETYRAAFTEPARLADTIVVELDGETIGDLMLRVEDAWAQAEVADRAASMQAELGWVLDPARTGHGYATEAVRALLRICFEDLGVRRAVATCFAGNDTSWRLMERVGMRREMHAVRDSLHRSGQWHDTFTYALLAEEWDQANQQGRHRGGEGLPHDWDASYAGTPPWDIGRPQRPFIELSDAGALHGAVLDVGCGTGEHTLLAAGRGLQATGVDVAPTAIASARVKASQRGLDARFLVQDALTVDTLGETFDVVLDCGFFHVLSDEARGPLADVLRRVMAPGASYYLLCFSDRVPGDAGPRRIRQDEIRAVFAYGFSVDWITESSIEATFLDVPVPAWFARITRQ